jgi:hypothetical protein
LDQYGATVLALLALAIAGLGVRDIMGYCVTALLFPGVVFIRLRTEARHMGCYVAWARRCTII